MRRLAVLAAVPLLFAAACGGSSSTKSGEALPTASGSFGSKPTLTFPSGKPPAALEKKVLHEGTGTTVAKGDLLVANYLGQIWKGKVFDNSYDRKQPAAFPIGVGQVIPGWDKELVGVKIGSRVLLNIPPADGYGTQGNSNAGISGTDTLEFVVDVVATYPSSATGDPHAAPQKVPANTPHVAGALGSRPTITIPKGLAEPKTTSLVVLAKGTGAPVKAGLVIVQYEAVDWTGKAIGSTWQNGTPAGVPVGSGTQTGTFDKLIGVPLGSRVLLLIPGQQGQKAAAVVLDLAAQPPASA